MVFLFLLKDFSFVIQYGSILSNAYGVIRFKLTPSYGKTSVRVWLHHWFAAWPWQLIIHLCILPFFLCFLLTKRDRETWLYKNVCVCVPVCVSVCVCVCVCVSVVHGCNVRWLNIIACVFLNCHRDILVNRKVITEKTCFMPKFFFAKALFFFNAIHK